VNGACDALNETCTCNIGFYGINCNETCPCVHGVCDALNGTCNCGDEYYGVNCSGSCACVNGVCNPLNGSCSCQDNFVGLNCDQRCIDINCTIPCVCNDSNACSPINFTCQNNIVIKNQNFTFIPSLIQVSGNMIVDHSNIDINSNEIYFDHNITLSDSNIIFNSSSIIAGGCINISNSIITVDLSNVSNSKSILLLNSTAGCLIETSLVIFYMNQPACSILKNETNSYSLFVIFEKQSCEQKNNLIPTWEIALIITGSIVGLGIIFVVLVLIIPSLRHCILKKKIIN